MSGAEAVLAVGLISSIVAIVDGTKQVFEAAKKTHGLPDAFREVAGRLPIVWNILNSIKQYAEDGYIDEASCAGVKAVVDLCGEKAKTLEELFHKVIPEAGSSRKKRYLSAVKTLGKGSRVEVLMKGMLEDLQLLAFNHGIRTVSRTQTQEITRAISEVSAIPPSVPEHLLEGPNTSSAPQNSYDAQGINFGGGKQFNYTAHIMNFGAEGKD